MHDLFWFRIIFFCRYWNKEFSLFGHFGGGVSVCVFVKDRIYLNIKYTAICLVFQFADYCWWGCCMFGSCFSIHLLSVRLFIWLLVAFYHVKLRIGLQFTNNNNNSNMHHSKWPNKKNRIEWGTKKKMNVDCTSHRDAEWKRDDDAEGVWGENPSKQAIQFYFRWIENMCWGLTFSTHSSSTHSSPFC